MRLRPRSRRGGAMRAPEHRRPGRRPQPPGTRRRARERTFRAIARGRRTGMACGGHCVARRRRHLSGSGRPSPSRRRGPARAQV